MINSNNITITTQQIYFIIAILLLLYLSHTIAKKLERSEAELGVILDCNYNNNDEIIAITS